MISTFVFLTVLGLGLVGWFAARARARGLYSGRGSLHSMPVYHGWHLALWIVIPALIIWTVWQAISPGLIEATVLTGPLADKLPIFDVERRSILAEAWTLANNPAAIAFNPLAAEFAEPLRGAQIALV